MTNMVFHSTVSSSDEHEHDGWTEGGILLHQNFKLCNRHFYIVMCVARPRQFKLLTLVL